MTELNIIEENKLFFNLLKEENDLAFKCVNNDTVDNKKAYLNLLEFISYLHLNNRIDESFVKNNLLHVLKELKEEINQADCLEQLKELIIKLKI